MKCLVGIDDTDSSSGFCTTYLAYRMAVELPPVARVLPYPRLVRLNPNVPFKTRGNAAVCLRLETEGPEEAFERATVIVKRLSDLDHGANSGMVFAEEPRSLVPFRQLYDRAVSGMVNRHSVENLLKAEGVRTFTLGNGMGLIGAASSLGFEEGRDHTYELISYRLKEFWGSERIIDATSVKEMDRRTFPFTFNNYDYQKKKVLITPAGPDPVFFGIRGATPQAVVAAARLLEFDERLDGQMVYISNQYTDAHARNESSWKVYSSGWVEGVVRSTEVRGGGHLYTSILSRGRIRRCAFYEPTGDLRRAALHLRTGDTVRFYGGVRRPSRTEESVLNVEKFQLLSFGRETRTSNPNCEECGRRMKSEGSGKGSECRHCGTRLPEGARVNVTPRRTIIRGTYAASARANRHLSKPLIRYGMENVDPVRQEIEGWLESFSTPMRELARSPQ